jgi:membrane protein DedA with SNARE-associated domain
LKKPASQFPCLALPDAGTGGERSGWTRTTWEGVLLLELAKLIGASVLYFATLRVGRSLVYRYGRYMHFTPERLDRAAMSR